MWTYTHRTDQTSRILIVHPSSLHKFRGYQFVTANAVLMAFCCIGMFTARPAAAAQAVSQVPARQRASRGVKISGLGVILKVETAGGERIFEADGYRVGIAVPGTVTSFTGSLKSLSDVTAGNWVRFEGRRDRTSVVIASTADFYPAGTITGLTILGPKKARKVPDYQNVTQGGMVDSVGHVVKAGKKVRLSDAEGPCGWHKLVADEALQERVRRIGMRLVPDYQKKLAADEPSRILFRFYVIADHKVRSVLACNTGLILVPKNVVERLQEDDQLAAVLAEGVAFNLVEQSFSATGAVLETAVGVAAATGLGSLGYWFGTEGTGAVLDREHAIRVARASARIALQLMNDAGYDPWQAPEAWRRLAPRKLPADIQSLEYTPEGRYQLGILKAQDSRAAYSAHGPSS
jgi:hypothetical protein